MPAQYAENEKKKYVNFPVDELSPCIENDIVVVVALANCVPKTFYFAFALL